MTIAIRTIKTTYYRSSILLPLSRSFYLPLPIFRRSSLLAFRPYSSTNMSDPALDLLSEKFLKSMLLNADPNQVNASITSQLPTLTPEQESKQGAILALSETFPESAPELSKALGSSKFLLGTDTPSLADLITYARVRKPVVETWTPAEYQKNGALIRWADRVQKSALFKDTPVDDEVKIDIAVLGGSSEKKPKKEKGPKPQPAKKEAAPITPAMVDLRVGFIQKAIEHPDADSLYVSTIDMGDPTGPRTVCSGLRKYIPFDDMQQRYVIVVANLKPVTMRGIKSEAMVLCASNDDIVEFTTPPEGSKAGDKIFFEGFDGTPEAQLNPKKKIFETLQPNFTTNEDLEVVFKTVEGEERKLVNKAGKIVKAPTLIRAQVR
ncbi:uncharacterized protein V1518DRAFT_417580 [Limtongia smithiae]|uniref:uncharacterized protein n=1 Tax=Limtongia smithiae TaxID=1125753 RepID=UPI0034CFAF39